jgi:hypothetical protein
MYGVHRKSTHIKIKKQTACQFHKRGLEENKNPSKGKESAESRLVFIRNLILAEITARPKQNINPPIRPFLFQP